MGWAVVLIIGPFFDEDTGMNSTMITCYWIRSARNDLLNYIPRERVLLPSTTAGAQGPAKMFPRFDLTHQMEIEVIKIEARVARTYNHHVIYRFPELAKIRAANGRAVDSAS